MSGAGVHERVSGAGRDLAIAFNDVLAALPGAPLRPIDVTRVLRINKDLSARIVKAVQQHDPLATVHLIPGPEPLKRTLRAARSVGVREELVSRAERAVDRFDELIRVEAGDRAALDTMISSWLPEVREKHELEAKQMAFRGLGLVKGVQGGLNVTTLFLHPSATSETHCDLVAVLGTYGLCRFRPTAAIRFGAHSLVDGEDDSGLLTLDGAPARQIDGLRLDAFCSEPLMEFRAQRVMNTMVYEATSADVGINASANVILAQLEPRAMLVRRQPDTVGRGVAGLSSVVTFPVQTLVFDVFVHREIFHDVEPRLALYDTVPRGFVDPNDPMRDIDRLELSERIQSCGWGTENLHLAEVPRYREMVHHVLARVGWDGQSMRLYRCQIRYPMYGSQACMIFSLPDLPGEASGSPAGPLAGPIS